ncbi:MAG: hypothetical protein A3G24_02365 [Betaproteobacteria bacterium RIFCSPLOWO2_12_FULL_62_13]|nr:MAG: hypothetical protein A3G24_02365 [Betaproteobacteria bacterium RIFCSPLOWO2_12_FULL_62_13]
MGLRLFACVCLCLTVAFPVSAQQKAEESKLLPIDEAGKDPSWVNFRNRLVNALAKRDRKFVLSIVDRNIRNSLDSPRGVAAFRKQWDFDAEESPVWRELSAALFLGSAWLKPEKGPRQLCAPYVAVKWPEDIDPFDHGAIISREVLVKAGPSSESATLATLSYDIVPVPDWEVTDQAPEAKQKWVKIKLKEVDGFVPEEQIRSPVEHRACFVKTESGWRLMELVVGIEK